MYIHCSAWTMVYSQIVYMGFVQEQVSANPQWRNWQRKFLVLRRAHIEMFSTVPVCSTNTITISDNILQLTVSEWMRPERSYALTEISIELLQVCH